MSNKHRISEINAKNIFTEFIDKPDRNKIVSIEGSYGSGKSTTKEELKKLLSNADDKNGHYILVDYRALQYEEVSQITSQLYIQIAKKMHSCCNKHILSAASVLKRENVSASYITGGFGVLALLVTIAIAAMKYFLEILGWSNSVLFIILIMAFFVVFLMRDRLVANFAGMLPRYTHVDLLRNDLCKVDFDGATFILLIDEIDRLNGITLKLLLDEILILHEILKERDIDHIVLLFHNIDITKQLLESCKIPDVTFYLQKYSQDSFKILKPDLLHNLHKEIFDYKPSVSIISNNHSPANGIFANEYGYGLGMPSSNILMCIANNLRSFRDLDRFVGYLSSNLHSIADVIHNHGEPEHDIQQILDVLITEMFFAFRYDKKLSQVLDGQDREMKSVYKEFYEQLYYIYENIDIELNTQVDSVVNRVESVYYKKTHFYPAKVDGDHVSFHDYKNNLENILELGYETKAARKKIVDYISVNLSEFAISAQAVYPHLGTLQNKEVHVKEENVKDFLLLISDLEDAISNKLFALKNFNYSFSYAKDLYNAAIKAICYCMSKLIPFKSDEFEKIIDQAILELKNVDNNFKIILLYIALERMKNSLYPGVTKPDILNKLAEAIEEKVKKVKPNSFTIPNSIFLFEYFYIQFENTSIPIDDIETFIEDFRGVIRYYNNQAGILTYSIGVTIFGSLYEKNLDAHSLISATGTILKDYSIDGFKIKNKNSFYKAVSKTFELYRDSSNQR